MFALPIFPGSRPSSIVGANELNFCVRDGRVAPRRLWRMQRSISVCRGLWATKAHLRQGDYRAPQMKTGGPL